MCGYVASQMSQNGSVETAPAVNWFTGGNGDGAPRETIGRTLSGVWQSWQGVCIWSVRDRGARIC
jgi:hypothetical protein